MMSNSGQALEDVETSQKSVTIMNGAQEEVEDDVGTFSDSDSDSLSDKSSRSKSNKFNNDENKNKSKRGMVKMISFKC